MVTLKELEWVEFYAAWVARVQVHGFEWNAATKSLSATQRKWKTLANCCFIAWHGFVCLFCISRFYSALKTPSAEVGTLHLVGCFFSAVCECAVFISHAPVAFTRSELANLLRHLTAFNSAPGRRTTPTKREKVINLLEKAYLVLIPPGLTAMAISQALAFHGEGTLWTLFGVIVTFVHAPLSTFAASAVFGLMQMYMVLFFVTVYDTLPRLERKKLTEDSIDETLVEYRTLSILCNRFNAACGLLLVPAVKCSAGLGGLCCLYMAFRVVRRSQAGGGGFGLFAISIFNGFYLLGLIIIGAGAMSSLWVVSDKFLTRMKQSSREILLKHKSSSDSASRKALTSTLTIKSFLPLRLYVGNLYYMEKEAKLTFMQFLATALVNMLLLT